MSADELSQLLDREKIRDCLARLARGEDRRNPELITGAYWPCAAVDLGIFTGSFDEYLAWVVPGSPDIPVTQHVLGQSLIDLHSDSALVETHALAYHRVVVDGGHRDTVIGGRYVDWMEKSGGAWRIAKRTMIYDWFQDLGEAADWSTGLMGMPFDTAGYAGRAHGDPSEGLLGDRWTPEMDDATE
ncbi:MAG TPA: nuclear transport factor 2 family protein [Mycobacterium sp.]